MAPTSCIFFVVGAGAAAAVAGAVWSEKTKVPVVGVFCFVAVPSLTGPTPCASPGSVRTIRSFLRSVFFISYLYDHYLALTEFIYHNSFYQGMFSPCSSVSYHMVIYLMVLKINLKKVTKSMNQSTNQPLRHLQGGCDSVRCEDQRVPLQSEI